MKELIIFIVIDRYVHTYNITIKSTLNAAKHTAAVDCPQVWCMNVIITHSGFPDGIEVLYSIMAVDNWITI